MKNWTKSSEVPPAPVADHRQRQAKTLLPEHTRVGAKPKSSRPIAEHPKNHLAWYVPLKTKESEWKVPRIHQIKWKRPPKFSLNPEWQVAAGEESKLAAVPPESLTWPLMEADCHDDSQTTIIPIIPIEEVGAEMTSDTPVTVITSANPQPLASSPSVAECPNQHVHETSLPHRLHGLEGDDLIAAGAAVTIAAVMQNKTIDFTLVAKYLTDLDLIAKVNSGGGLASKPADEAPPASNPNTCLPSPSLTAGSMIDTLPVSKGALSDSTPQTVNQSLFLPSSKSETDIKKYASKLGGLHAGSGLRRKKAENQTPSLSCSKAETEIKAASEPEGMRVRSGHSTQKANNQSPLLPCSKAETEANKNVRAESGRIRAESGTCTLKAEDHSSFLPCSKDGGLHAGSGAPTENGEKRPSPSPGLNSDRPTKKWTGESGGRARSCTDQIVQEQKARTLVSSTLRANEGMSNERSKDNGGSDFTGVKAVNSLSPYPSKPKMEAMKKMINNYRSCDVAQVRPMAPPPVLPNEEEMDRVIDKYLSDHGRREPFVGPNHPLLRSTAPAPVTNLRAYPNALEPRFNGAETFHPSFHPMTIPGRQVDVQYHQPLSRRREIPNIWQSGNKRIEMNPIHQRPCMMHFSNPAGCPYGYNCPYQHDEWSRRDGGGGPPREPW